MPLTGHVVGDVRIRECASCNGLWVPEERFELLMAKAVESQKKLDADTTERLKPRIRGANPARQKVLYRSCLVCRQQMQRRNFRKTSGVIIDRCNQHGTWLDADELERISGFLISGGRPMADWYLRNEAATAQKTVLRPAYNPPAPTVQLQRSRHFPVRRQRDTGGLGGLMRIFAELLD
jgi:Zn-finger nucleic acid-binding protein